MIKVFVYGTLRKGFVNDYLLRESEYLGDFTLPGWEMRSLGPFPTIVKRNTGAVVGEVYEITDTLLGALDRLEGYPFLYTRVKVDTSKGEAWVYVSPYDNEVGYLVKCGDWSKVNEQ